MRKDKEKAIALRLSGKSYNEITSSLGVPKSTLSGWFCGLVLSSEARERIQQRVHSGALRGLLKRNANQTHLAVQRMREIRAESQREIKSLSQRELQLIGIALYWAEGYKRPQIRHGRDVTYHSVSLTNSDPRIIQAFLRFLREVCNVPNEKIKADIRIYEHMNSKELLTFWQKITKLPKENFGKMYYGISRSSLRKRPFNRLPHGTILIRVNSTNLFHRIIGWIEGLGRVVAGRFGP